MKQEGMFEDEETPEFSGVFFFAWIVNSEWEVHMDKESMTFMEV